MPVSHLFHSAFEHSDVHQAVPWIVRVEETLDLSSCFFLLTPGLAESSANIITIVDAAAVGLPQKPWRMFAQDHYQFQHTFSHSDDFR